MTAGHIHELSVEFAAGCVQRLTELLALIEAEGDTSATKQVVLDQLAYWQRQLDQRTGDHHDGC